MGPDFGRAIGDAIGATILWLSVLCIVFVPLGLWKLVEIVYWLFTNVSVNWT